MPTYKGNVGNLMQHWTLCELVRIAGKRGIPGLNFIDAHAMAPLAREKDHGRTIAQFNRAEACVQNPHEPHHQWSSKYEWAWHHLAPIAGYPNSAAFVEKVWESRFSLLLCEVDWPTIAELAPWRHRVGNLERCTNAELFTGDWRDRFAQGLPNPANVGLDPDSLTLVSFDPNMYYPLDPRNANPRNLYPNDLQTTLNALRNVEGVVIMLLSTYDKGRRNEAAQAVVIPNVDEILTPACFHQAAVVIANQQMMSLVYVRGLDEEWFEKLQGLPDRFNDWRRRI